MEQLIYGLTIAGVAAITYVAYKHPAAYRKRFFFPIVFITNSVYMGILIWNMATIHARLAADYSLIKYNDIESKVDAAIMHDLPNINIAVITQLSVSVYATFLCFLEAMLASGGRVQKIDNAE
jgi:hypothetical protein